MGIEVGSGLGAAKDEMGERIPFRLYGCNLAFGVDVEEGVGHAGREDAADGDIELSMDVIFESHGKGEARGHLPMRL